MAGSPTYGQDLGTKRLAYSPDWIAGAFLDFHVRGFEAVLRTNYVSKQYFTNEQVDVHSMDAYCVTNLNLGYTLRAGKMRSVRFGVMLYNLFDQQYESNGYGYSYMEDGRRVDATYYFPQAPLHVLANVTVRF